LTFDWLTDNPSQFIWLETTVVSKYIFRRHPRAAYFILFALELCANKTKLTPWPPDIAGFVFLDLASSFKPPEELTKFLDAGEPPVYIGFGSIVVDDPDKFTKMIFDAVKQAGVRALVSKGWGGLGDDDAPESVYMLDNTPHDWLFPKVSCVVHHGGAGTTAIGLKCGKPTMIVPFFGGTSESPK
jgi:UDP:flavonoid glycosyltransferase YjiC (YdhE family)